MNRIPRVAAVQDLSCLGRCSLTVTIPTLSVMGFQVVPIPTSLLSSQTDGYEGPYVRDLTADMKEIFARFQAEKTTFRAIYSGYLGNADQVALLEQFLLGIGQNPDETGKNPLIMVDPVMGDDGKFYATYNAEMAEKIKSLCRFADVLTPNLTEACFLTGIRFEDTANMSETELNRYTGVLFDGISSLSNAKTVITGVPMKDGKIGNFCLENGRKFTVADRRIWEKHPGSGDLFASVLLGKMLSENTFEESVKFAAGFLTEALEASVKSGCPIREGVPAEPLLSRLGGAK